MTDTGGPLRGVRVLELGGIGPVPFAGMMLADMGAEVVRVHRIDAVERGVDPFASPVMDRARRSIGLDLKAAAGVECALRLAAAADVVLEGFRPGVVERMGLGPDECLGRNPKLVFGRMTGWGQDGPLAQAAGHDIDYIAVAGVLAHIGRRDAPPTPPLNLIGDFGGGGMLLAFGVMCALFEAQRSGRGQVVDAAMVDGAALLMAMIWGHKALGRWTDERGANIYDSGAPDYDVYETADGEYVAFGAREPKFFAELLARLGLDAEALPKQSDRDGWPVLHDAIAAVIATAHPRRVVRGARRRRRVLRAGAADGRGGAPPAHRGPGNARGTRRSGAAGAGTATLAHAGARWARRCPGPAPTATPCSATGASRPTRSRGCTSPASSRQRSPDATTPGRSPSRAS